MAVFNLTGGGQRSSTVAVGSASAAKTRGPPSAQPSGFFRIGRRAVLRGARSSATRASRRARWGRARNCGNSRQAERARRQPGVRKARRSPSDEARGVDPAREAILRSSGWRSIRPPPVRSVSTAEIGPVVTRSLPFRRKTIPAARRRHSFRARVAAAGWKSGDEANRRSYEMRPHPRRGSPARAWWYLPQRGLPARGPLTEDRGFRFDPAPIGTRVNLGAIAAGNRIPLGGLPPPGGRGPGLALMRRLRRMTNQAQAKSGASLPENLRASTLDGLPGPDAAFVRLRGSSKSSAAISAICGGANQLGGPGARGRCVGATRRSRKSRDSEARLVQRQNGGEGVPEAREIMRAGRGQT